MADLEWVSNNEGTRWFLVLKCQQPDRDELNELLGFCNSLCKDFGLSQLYRDDVSSAPDDGSMMKKPRWKLARARRKSLETQKEREGLRKELSWNENFDDHFHFSIAWCLKEPQEEPGFEERAIENLMQDVANIVINFDSVKVKIGNVVTSLELDRVHRRDK